LEDFHQALDFHTAFVAPFQPGQSKPANS